MTNYLCTLATRGEAGFSDRGFFIDRLLQQAQQKRLDTTRFVWDWARLASSHLYVAYRHLFTKECMLAYWIWKPYMVLDALMASPDGDVIACLDSDLSITGDMEPLINHCQENGMTFIQQGFLNRQFSRKHCFEKMDAIGIEFTDHPQIWGAATFWKSCYTTRRFVVDWLVYCLNEDILNGGADGENLPGFQDHRWTQSILTNLIVKYGIGSLPNSYAQIFAHPPW